MPVRRAELGGRRSLQNDAIVGADLFDQFPQERRNARDIDEAQQRMVGSAGYRVAVGCRDRVGLVVTGNGRAYRRRPDSRDDPRP